MSTPFDGAGTRYFSSNGYLSCSIGVTDAALELLKKALCHVTQTLSVVGPNSESDSPKDTVMNAEFYSAPSY